MSKTKFSIKLLALLAVALIAVSSFFVLFVPGSALAAETPTYYVFHYTHDTPFYSFLTPAGGAGTVAKEFYLCIKVVGSQRSVQDLYFKDFSSLYYNGDFTFVMDGEWVFKTSTGVNWSFSYFDVKDTYESAVITMFGDDTGLIQYPTNIAAYNDLCYSVDLDQADFSISPTTYTVMYHPNYSGAPAMQPTVAVTGSTITLPSPTRAGYKFAGWYTLPTGGDFIGLGGSSYTVTQNITLYAHWTVIGSGGNDNPGGSFAPLEPPALDSNGNVDLSNTQWLLNDTLDFTSLSSGIITFYATLTLNKLPDISYSVNQELVNWNGTFIGDILSYSVTTSWTVSKQFSVGSPATGYIYSNTDVHGLPGYDNTNEPYPITIFAYDSQQLNPFNFNRIITFPSDSKLAIHNSRFYNWLLSNATYISALKDYSQGYDYGYDRGYNSGYSDGQLSANSTVNGSSASYTAGYQEGYAAGVRASGDYDYSFIGLISAVIDVPIQAFASLFNFDLLGVNMLNLATSILTILVVLAVCKIVIGFFL